MPTVEIGPDPIHFWMVVCMVLTASSLNYFISKAGQDSF